MYDFIQENYAKSENISVDYAIMETSKNVYVIAAEFDWNDLGTWGSLYDKLDKDTNGNAVVNTRTLTEDSSGNMIRTANNKIVVVDGLQDYIIVDKEDVLLIYPKSKEQDIKKVLQKVKGKFQWLMDYTNTYKHMYVWFYDCNIWLHMFTDAAFMVLFNTHSRNTG